MDALVEHVEFAHQADYGDFNSENDSSWALYEDDLKNIDFEKFAIKAGFQLKDNLIRCDWRGKKDSCSADNFTEVIIFIIMF